MQKNKYRITLYDTCELKTLLTYDYPILPNPITDFIEIENDKAIFIIENRSFKPLYDGGLIQVILYGTVESSKVRSLMKLRKVKKRVREILNQESRPHPVFPETLE